MKTFVPENFTIPPVPASPVLVLTQLLTDHNESDLAAWSASYDQIHGTPGYEGYPWPPVEPYSLEQNRGDLQGHMDDWAARQGFTYTVLDPNGGDVIGCVYIYPSKDDPSFDAHIRSWVRGDKPELDKVLHDLISTWVATEWPFTNVRYAPR
jgi:hypothetical protein